MVKVELSLFARRLKNVAGPFKTSDPFCVVTHIATRDDEMPRVLGKTEVIENNLDPNFSKVFILDYELGTPVKIAVSLFDKVKKGKNIPMGSAVFELGSVLGARGGAKIKKLRTGGTVTAVVRKSQGEGALRFKMKATNLKNTEGFLRKSDPFFEVVKKTNATGVPSVFTVFRSEVVKNDLSPEWKTACIEISTLCGGDLDEAFSVKIYDHESSGKNVLMGEFETTCSAIVGLAGLHPIQVKVKGKETGSISIVSASISIPQEGQSTAKINISPSSPATGRNQQNGPETSVSPFTFVDYVAGGCQLNVTVAIDFTGSNGDPRQPGTLHYLHEDGQMNDYEKAITAILNVLSQYDSDKKFPVLGFGAKYAGEVLHAFQVGDASQVEGVQGVLKAYRDVFKSGAFTMSSPVVFNEVIQYAANRAEEQLNSSLEVGKQCYSILLLLTHGCVSDVEATAERMREVSDMPISIVIVGIGNANFSGMRFLDDLRQAGERDIVQFVDFEKYRTSPADLSSVTLKEIPTQLVTFFQEVAGIPPLEQEPLNAADGEGEEEDEIDLSLDFQGDGISLSRGGFDFQHSKW